MTIAVISVCVLLVLIGAAMALRWGHLDVVPPWPAGGEPVSLGEQVRRAAWWVDVHLLAGLAAGLLVLGPGGRLVMRLLAVTAGERAQGRITEAEEIVGRITVGGTIGLVLFTGLFGGAMVAVVGGALRPWLPARRWGALAIAVVLGVTTATTGEPLRPANPDFSIVGPGWLAVVTFLGVGLLATLTFTALTGRISRALPLPGPSLGGILPYVPIALLVPTGVGGILVLAVVVGALVLAWAPARRVAADRRLVLAGRVVLVAVVAVQLPRFVGDLAEIL